LWETNLDIDEVIKTEDMSQISDSDQVELWTKTVIDENLELIPRLLKGEEKLYEFFIGSVMKKSRGKANPHLVRQSLERRMLKQCKDRSTEDD
ncbi:MAG: hypothetical protein F4Z01_05925, partial [Gammaproteobacteria bacterium]|nr:hypothetical protein [Gammaproteobacteria bacterium]